jgi:hypothetical protein
MSISDKIGGELEELATTTLTAIGLVPMFYDLAFRRAQKGETPQLEDARAQAAHARKMIANLSQRLDDIVRGLDNCLISHVNSDSRLS